MATTERSPAEVLRAARELIRDPKCWTKGRLSDAQRYGFCPEKHREGSCWCEMGALMCECIREEQFDGLAHLLIQAGGGAKQNDRGTHAEALAHFDRAIELAEAA